MFFGVGWGGRGLVNSPCHRLFSFPLASQNAQVEGPLGASATWPDSVSERPPYSYMAMIQFAINSTERKRMTLKDIYTWIEDHFPYFKHIAKPGWKVPCPVTATVKVSPAQQFVYTEGQWSVSGAEGAVKCQGC